MNRYEVTFHFKNCDPKVSQVGRTAGEAEYLAREASYPPIPEEIKATVVEIKRGGARPGSGRKFGVTNPASRNNRVTVRLNDKELEKVTARAKAAGLSVPDYQRQRLLG